MEEFKLWIWKILVSVLQRHVTPANFKKFHSLTNDALHYLKGFLYLLSKSSFSALYYSLRNIFHSCGKDVQCKQSLHHIRALNLIFLLRKMIQDPSYCLTTAKNKFCFSLSRPNLLVHIRGMKRNSSPYISCKLMPSDIYMTTPISYLSETICSHISQEQVSMKWLVPSIIAMSGVFPACPRFIICISNLSS